MRLASGRTLDQEIGFYTDGQNPHPIRWVIARDVAEAWEKTYSADQIIIDKPKNLRGSIELAGQEYVVMGCVGSGAKGPMTVDMCELIPLENWPHGSTFHYHERFTSTLIRRLGRNYWGCGPYRVTRKRQQYVLGWEWSAVVSPAVPEGGIININQGSLFDQKRPYPCDMED